MLAFKGWYDERYEYDDEEFMYSARWIPTNRDMNEMFNHIYERVINQIVSGQSYYYGYDCETHADNNIPEISDEKIERILNKKSYYVKKVRVPRTKKERTPRMSKVYKMRSDMRKLGLSEAEIDSLTGTL